MKKVNEVPIREHHQIIKILQTLGAFILVAASMPIIALGLIIMNLWERLVKTGYYERK